MTRSFDFETFSSVDIKLGAWNYSLSPDCDVLTMSYRGAAGEMLRWNPTMPAPTELLDYVRAGGGMRGWNAGGFEYLIWKHVCAPKYGWPPLPMAQIWDTMIEAAAHNLPQSLERCGAALNIPEEKLKSRRGKRLIQLLCKPQKRTKNQPHAVLTRDIAPDLFDELAVYCDSDVVAEEAIARKLRPLSDSERALWLLTMRLNEAGVPVALDEARNITQIVRAETDRLNEELRELTDGDVPKATGRAALLKWLAARGLGDEVLAGADEETAVLSDMRGGTVDAVLRRSDLDPEVRRTLEIRRQVVQTSSAKFAKILAVAAPDGTLKGMHAFHGASTGRWASRGGINTQNFSRPTLSKLDLETAHTALGAAPHSACSSIFDDELMKAAVSCLRGVIKAPPGFEFVDADLSSIENRTASWLAGQQDKLAMFEDGFDEYKVLATKLFHVEYEDVTKAQRQLSKPVVLGCVYGLGAKGLADYAAMYGVAMSSEECARAVRVFREDYSHVKETWWAAGDASLEAVRNPGEWQPVGQHLALIVHRNALWMRLPSGRLICWMRPRIDNLMVPWKEKKVVGYDVLDNPIAVEVDVFKDVCTVEQVDSFTRAWKRDKLIGSNIFQSACQAVARDVFAHGLGTAVTRGFDPRLLVHDEILCCERIGARTHLELVSAMCEKAPWMDGLPLAADGWTGQRYAK